MARADWAGGRARFYVALLTCAVKHSMSGWRNSHSACHTLLPFSSLVFCMKSDSRMWPQIGAKRYTKVCNERKGVDIGELRERDRVGSFSL